MMLARGITLSHGTVRQWCAKFRPDLRQRIAPATSNGCGPPGSNAGTKHAKSSESPTPITKYELVSLPVVA
jgi:hypothetical protein